MKTLQVLHLTVSEAEHLVRRVRNSSVLRTYGIEIKLVPSAEKMPLMADGAIAEMQDAVNLVVEAETDVQAGIGKGFLIAISEGIS